MPSPNLAVTHVAAAQNQKEVTINDAVDALDNAMNQALSVAMADANLTLTGTQANRNGLIILTGTLTASRILTLPANHRRLAIRNATNGGQDVRAKYAGSGAEVIIVPGATVLVQGNGSDLYGVGGGAGTLGDLTDVSIAGAANGDVLQFDGAAWGAAGVGTFNRALLPFRGALLRRSTNFSVATTGVYVAVSWQSAEYDSDAFWDAGQPSRLTIPAGVTKVRIVGNIEWQTSPTSQLVEVRKNGNSVLGGGSFIVRGDSGYSNQMRNLSSAVLPVSAGDWFELAVYVGTAGELRSLERTWLAIEVVETADAADPPADISGYKAGQPAADEVILRVPVARRTRLKIDLAGSHASAEAAATAQTDFDIRVDGVSSATMRFAAAATSATFIAASETVLEPGQVLSVVAPSTPDATLAGIGFTLAGSLVL
ncbi:hypothetical protein IMF23_04505 [Chelatococcus daeguensis]|uniref:hypothetical protein n=1 Tax=Chelatococcus daeguensis TaxID=444444 RepID=UPI0007AB5AE9|nr:hypothetical protein [Chelatococcus daeguensis]KZE33158.1 hypothetical protein AVW15_19435 [Chelatococcus daeguensis]MBM3082697.1 hypothetical protein [Chelatococcus daeguensis]